MTASSHHPVCLGVLSYILQQASTANLPPHLRTVVITDLSLGESQRSDRIEQTVIFPARRRQSGVEVAQLITDMYRTQPYSQWLDTLTDIGDNNYQTHLVSSY